MWLAWIQVCIQRRKHAELKYHCLLLPAADGTQPMPGFLQWTISQNCEPKYPFLPSVAPIRFVTIATGRVTRIPRLLFCSSSWKICYCTPGSLQSFTLSQLQMLRLLLLLTNSMTFPQQVYPVAVIVPVVNILFQNPSPQLE